MTLTITLKQTNKRPKVVKAAIDADIQTLRKLWEAEQILNNLHADLRVHIWVEE